MRDLAHHLGFHTKASADDPSMVVHTLTL
jgi:hypothetical protein